MWMMVSARDADDEPTWSLVEVVDGSANHFLTLWDEAKARRIMSALQWQDSLGDAKMSLSQSGITFDENTGKIWTAPKRKRGAPTLKIEPATRKRNAK